MKSWADVHIDIPGGSRGEIDTTCPECSHARKKKGAKCLSVNIEQGMWLCHHCAWNGTLKDGTNGRSDPWTWKPKTYKKPTYPVDLDLSSQAREFFEPRGLSVEILGKHKVSGGCVYMPQTEQQENIVQFPYFRKGELINVKYRGIKTKDFRMVGGAERILYGLDDLKGQEVGVFCEGEIDKLSFAEAGIPYVVSVPDGAPSPGSKGLDTKLSYLQSASEWLDPLKKIILATDNDAPGVFLRDELTRRLGADRCWTVTFPDGCKDANDVLMTHGAQVLRDVLEAARPIPVAGVVNLHEYDAAVQALFDSGVPPGESTGWPSLDTHYTIKQGQFTVITGAPGAGKSNFLDALLINLARNSGWRFGLFSPENYPPEGHVLRLIEKAVGQSARLNAFSRMSQEAMSTARDWVADHFWFFGYDENQLTTVDALLEQAASLVRREGIHGIVLDPWNEIEFIRERGQSETEYISLALTKIRKFTRLHRVHAWVVAHPTKMYRGADGNYPVPSLWDISGSAAWKSKADNGICVWRDDEARPPSLSVTIHIQKVRFREVGHTGEVNLLFVPSCGGYEEDVNREQAMF